MGCFTASFAPIIAVQIAFDSIFSTVCHPLVSSSGAGVASSVIVCPTEMIIIQQQKTGQSFLATARHIYNTYGLLGFSRGIIPTAMRESLFVSTYQYATPKVRDVLQSQGMEPWTAQITAGMLTGATAAVASHPFDTYKTQVQEDFMMKVSMIAGVFKKSAFAGLSWRIAMVITATTVISYMQQTLYSHMTRQQY